jgi:hypothetical protein
LWSASSEDGTPLAGVVLLHVGTDGSSVSTWPEVVLTVGMDALTAAVARDNT